MKFSVFADFHYNPGVFYKGTWEDMDFILKRAEVQNVDFIIHVGDLFSLHHACIYISGDNKVSNYNDRNNDRDIRSSEDTTDCGNDPSN